MTGGALNITQDAATIAYNTFSGFMGMLRFAGVEYSTTPDMSASMTAQGAPHSPFSVELTGLQSDTVYYYRAVVCASGACCAVKCCAGEVMSFVTHAPAPVPVVETGIAQDVLETSAIIADNTFSGIPGTIDFVGVEFDTDPNMIAPMVTYAAINSPFSVGLSGLQPDTTYYYRAVVVASGGTHYGEIRSMRTQAPTPIVITGDAVNILGNSATISNNVYSGITGTINYVAVQYSTSPTMTSATTTQGTISSPFSVNLTGLQVNTTYYYRAAVSASTGTYFGEIKSFTTPQGA